MSGNWFNKDIDRMCEKQIKEFEESEKLRLEEEKRQQEEELKKVKEQLDQLVKNKDSPNSNPFF